MQFGFGLDLTHLRPASVDADPIAGLYGTGMGQIPMHHDPEAAVLDGNGNVTSIANRGGAGPLFNATASATGITRTGNLLNVTSQGLRLVLANPADMVGTRLFIVAAFDPASVPDPRLFGNASPVNFGRIHQTQGNLLLSRAGAQVFLASPTNLGNTLHLFEIELAGGKASYWVDGVLRESAANAWTDFTITMLYGATTGFGFIGRSGAVLSVVTDGTAARDGTMLDVRRALAAKHGITLP